MDKVQHRIYIDDRLAYEILDSVWYDTASPAQACIKKLREIQGHVPNVRIISYGREYAISTQAAYMEWVRNVFSPTPEGVEYECDFSHYL